MTAIRVLLRILAKDKRGATAIEYSLIAALIGIGIAGSLSLLGGGTDGMWTKINTELEDAWN